MTTGMDREDGVVVTDMGRGEGGSVGTTDDDTTATGVGVITDIDARIEAGIGYG